MYVTLNWYSHSFGEALWNHQSITRPTTHFICSFKQQPISLIICRFIYNRIELYFDGIAFSWNAIEMV